MATSLAEVRKLVMKLNNQDRDILTQELISISEQPELTEVDKAWLRVAERRYRDYKTGKTKGIPAEEVFAELRQDSL